MARDKAREILGEVVRGDDPAAEKRDRRRAMTVSELCDQYWAEMEAGNILTRWRAPKKTSTMITDRGRVDRHIKPLIGHLKVASVTVADVEGLMRAVTEGKTAARIKTDKKRGLANVRGGRGTANRVIGLLGGIFTYAVRTGLRQDNPVRGVTRPADRKRERRLSLAEYAAFGRALTVASERGIWPPAVACAQFLGMTGWRLGEALSLRWEFLDLSRQTAILPDSKTGRSLRPLASNVCASLAKMPRVTESGLVFPGSRGDGAMGGFRTLWQRIMALEDISTDITPHVLRHSFASLAADLGHSELVIGPLLGHAGATVTSRYVHSAEEVLIAAADAVAGRTAELMNVG